MLEVTTPLTVPVDAVPGDRVMRGTVTVPFGTLTGTDWLAYPDSDAVNVYLPIGIHVLL